MRSTRAFDAAFDSVLDEGRPAETPRDSRLADSGSEERKVECLPRIAFVNLLTWPGFVMPALCATCLSRLLSMVERWSRSSQPSSAILSRYSPSPLRCSSSPTVSSAPPAGATWAAFVPPQPI